MKVTGVRFAGKPNGRFVCYAKVEFDGQYVVNNFRLYRLEASGILRISDPRAKRDDGTWVDVAHPIEDDFRRYLEAEIYAAYERYCESDGQNQQATNGEQVQ